jgi:hypothetical protein
MLEEAPEVDAPVLCSPEYRLLLNSVLNYGTPDPDAVPAPPNEEGCMLVMPDSIGGT